MCYYGTLCVIINGLTLTNVTWLKFIYLDSLSFLFIYLLLFFVFFFFLKVKPQLLDFNRLCFCFQPAFLLTEGGGAQTITTISQVTLVYISKQNAEELCEMFYDIFYNRSIWPNPFQVHCWRFTVESTVFSFFGAFVLSLSTSAFFHFDVYFIHSIE